MWDKVAGYGLELVDVGLAVDRLQARGVAIGWHPVPYDLEYDLATSADWVTTRLVVRTQGDSWQRSLELTRSPAGTWSIATSATGRSDLEPAGGDPERFAGSLDCDLGLSPMTNTMPVLRTDLLRRHGSFDFLMAWVSVPDLSVSASRQRYTRLSDAADGLTRIEYRSLDGDFVSALTFDADGLVVDYPRLTKSVS